MILVKIDPRISLHDVDALAPLLTTRQIIDLSPSAPTAYWDELLRVLRGEVSDVSTQLDAAKAAEVQQAVEYARRTHEEYAARRWRSVIDQAREAVKWPGNDRAVAAWSSARGNARDMQTRLDLLLEQYEALQGWPIQGEASVEALETCEHALELSPDSSDWLARKLDTLVGLRRWHDALALARGLAAGHRAMVLRWLRECWLRERHAAQSPTSSYRWMNSRLDAWGRAEQVATLATELVPGDSEWMRAVEESRHGRFWARLRFWEA